MATSMIKHGIGPFKELEGVSITYNSDIRVPSDANEMVIDGLFQSGQHVSIHGIFPPINTSSVRVDNGFYYNANAYGSAAAVFYSTKIFRLFTPYFKGTETTFTSVRIFYR